MKYLIIFLFLAVSCLFPKDYISDSLVVYEILEKNELLGVDVKAVSTMNLYSRIDTLILASYVVSKIPLSIGRLDGLVKLDLSKNRITSLPDSIGNLKNLEHLVLNGNQLKSLPSTIKNLKKLKKIDLSENMIAELPEVLGDLTNITWLSLNSNRLTALPIKLGKMKNLQFLSLEDNQFKSLPPVLKQLPRLDELNLNYNLFTTLSDVVGGLKQLTVLKLFNNKLESLSPALGDLISLRTLNIDNNKLRILPKEIGKLSNLISLNLANNKLTSLPGEIGKLRNLNHLNLDNNPLSSLPKKIANLKNLKEMNLGKTRLCTLPKEVKAWLKQYSPGWEKRQDCYGHDTLIIRAILDSNEMEEAAIQNTVTTDKWGNIVSLNLASRGIKTLPASIGDFFKVTSIYLSHNQLIGLPDEIDKLRGLEKLYLDHNQLTKLPSPIWHLNRLDSLDLGFNQLCALSDTLKAWAEIFDPGYADKQDCSEFDTLPPTINLDKGEFSNLTADSIILSGSVYDMCSLVTLTASANSNTWKTDVVGNSNWSLIVLLIPGRNTIKLEAVDEKGNVGTKKIYPFYRPDYLPIDEKSYWKFKVTDDTMSIMVDSSYKIKGNSVYRLTMNNKYWDEDSSFLIIKKKKSAAFMKGASYKKTLTSRDTFFIKEYYPATKSFGKAAVTFLGDKVVGDNHYRNCVKVTFEDSVHQITRIRDFIFTPGRGPVGLVDRHDGIYNLIDARYPGSDVLFRARDKFEF